MCRESKMTGLEIGPQWSKQRYVMSRTKRALSTKFRVQCQNIFNVNQQQIHASSAYSKHMTEWKQNLYRNKEDLKIHSSLLSKQQKTWRKRKGKYMRLLIIQQCLVSNISSFMIECRLEVDKVATPFDVFHQSTCSWKLPRWSVHQPENLNLHEDLESESE